MRRPRNLVLAILSFFLGLAVIAGCGMKGPPLPPLRDGNLVAAPTDLAYTRNGQTVVLTWTHSVDPVNAKIPPEGFKMFLATKSPEQCEGCPFIFKEVGTVAMPDMQFHYTLEDNLRHYFRVQAVGANGRVSAFSKTLFIETESE